jgi:hypothetical protein
VLENITPLPRKKRKKSPKYTKITFCKAVNTYSLKKKLPTISFPKQKAKWGEMFAITQMRLAKIIAFRRNQ